jgi:hypothetical protein
MTADADNLLYSATNMGIQVADQLGRINFIIQEPAPATTDIKLAGTGFNTQTVKFSVVN